MRYLLDTNVISEPAFSRPNPHVIMRIEEYQSHVAIASTVYHELVFGCHRLPESKRKTIVERYLDEVVSSSIPILSYDKNAARWHASERVRLSAIGKTPPYADGQIAAVAVVNGLTLVTRNVSDFDLFKGLRIANWHDEETS